MNLQRTFPLGCPVPVLSDKISFIFTFFVPGPESAKRVWLGNSSLPNCENGIFFILPLRKTSVHQQTCMKNNNPTRTTFEVTVFALFYIVPKLAEHMCQVYCLWQESLGLSLTFDIAAFVACVRLPFGGLSFLRKPIDTPATQITNLRNQDISRTHGLVNPIGSLHTLLVAFCSSSWSRSSNAAISAWNTKKSSRFTFYSRVIRSMEHRDLLSNG